MEHGAWSMGHGEGMGCSVDEDGFSLGFAVGVVLGS